MIKKNKITNRLIYCLIIGLFAVTGMYANAGGGLSKGEANPGDTNGVLSEDDMVKEHLPVHLADIVKDYYKGDILTVLDKNDHNLIHRSNDGGYTWTKEELSRNVRLFTLVDNSKGIIVALGKDERLGPNDVFPDDHPLIMTFINDGNKWNAKAKILKTGLGSIFDDFNFGAYKHIRLNQNGFIIFGYHFVFTSDDGINWRTISGASLGLDHIYGAAMNRHGIIVVIGRRKAVTGQNDGVAVIVTLNVDKNQLKTAFLSTETTLRDVAVNSNGLFVVVGQSTSGKCFLEVSSDGIIWEGTKSELPSVCKSDHSILESIAVNPINGKFITVGQIRDRWPWRAAMMTSSDGQTWVDNSSKLPALGTFLPKVEVDGDGRFIMMDSNQRAMSRSTDGINWSKPIILP